MKCGGEGGRQRKCGNCWRKKKRAEEEKRGGKRDEKGGMGLKEVRSGGTDEAGFWPGELL